MKYRLILQVIAMWTEEGSELHSMLHRVHFFKYFNQYYCKLIYLHVSEIILFLFPDLQRVLVGAGRDDRTSVRNQEGQDPARANRRGAQECEYLMISEMQHFITQHVNFIEPFLANIYQI